MTHSFLKMHGLGNDFVVLDNRDGSLVLDQDRAARIANRRTGVGCDQVISLEPSQDGDVFMRIHNRDGSPAGACGNATRCIGSLLFDEMSRDEVVIETISGFLHTKKAANGLVTADLGPARLEWQDIPLAREFDTLHVPIEMDDGQGHYLEDAVAVNMGNPHGVMFVDDAEAIDLAAIGRDLEHHPNFPDRANMSIVSPLAEDHVRMRVWERGGGITLACGSGACAVAVACHRRGLTGRKVKITMDGGDLWLEWRESDGHVLMTGPVATSCRGELAPELLSA
jgi:diaminopimelate epimerase